MNNFPPSCALLSAYFARFSFYCRVTQRIERNDFPEKYKSPRGMSVSHFSERHRTKRGAARPRAIWGNGYFTSVAIKPHCYITAGAVINHSRGEAISHPGDCIRLAWRLLYYVASRVYRRETSYSRSSKRVI